MARQAARKKMTLSEALALRKQAAEEEQAREEERAHRLQTIESLKAMDGCTCPACMRLREMQRTR